MKDLTKLVASLREDATWAEANIWEVPIMLPDHLTQAADFLEELPSVQHGKLEGEDKMRSCSNCARKEAGEVCQLCFQADRWTPRAETHADRFRNMSDEELAQWISKRTGCPKDASGELPDECIRDCCQCWLNWLKKEGKE